MTVTALYTAHAAATGGRDGHTRSSDGVIDVDLSVPKELGGQGRPGATSPEGLFAAGYAACFGSACDLSARRLNLRPESLMVSAAVGIGPRGEGGFGLVVDLDVELSGLSATDADRLVRAAHAVCPYSNAVKGNVDVRLTAHTAVPA